MEYVESFPHRVQSQEHVWIPMRDGVRLSARLWLPEGAERDPVPAILEYIPYRKRDLTRERDALHHPYFAGHGYASVRVDLRGSGDSEGVLQDEYLQQELDDGLAILRWLGQQPWCDGSVGMIGISWGGFNGLQIASLQPPELKAVVSVCSSDDRYADDVHYMGGCLLTDNLSWASTMFAFNSCPPDPAIVGERWRDMWHERLRGSGLWIDQWLRHQRRDEFWKHGSICEDYSSVRCPVLAVSGWADGYSNAVLRMLRNLDVPRKGLVGPWSHKYPHQGVPGPAIGFLQECVRWWDHWLKGRQTGVEAEPMLRVWMQESVEPMTRYERRPGRWVAEAAWPSQRIEPREYQMALARLLPPERAEEAQLVEGDTRLTVQSPLTVGLFAGKWCSYAVAPDFPHDQREEDGGSLTFDTPELAEPLEILGTPVADLALEASAPVGMVALRLSDIAPDGQATRITFGLLNLTHYTSHEAPEVLEPGALYRVRVPLNAVAQRFPAGHSIRLSVSSSYWPLAWAPPRPVRLKLHPERSTFTLPVRPARAEDAQLHEFGPPEAAPPLRQEMIEPARHNWYVIRDLDEDRATLHVFNNDGRFRINEIETEVLSNTEEWYSSRGNDLGSLRGEVRAVRGFKRDGWNAQTVTRTVLTADAERFHIRAELDAYEHDQRVFSENWDRSVPRDHV